jgi:hypothetical protein
VVDPGGAPVEGAWTVLVDLRTGIAVVSEHSAADGSVEITGAGAGPHRLAALHDGWAPAVVPVSLPARAEPALVLRQPGRIEVQVAARDGGPVEGAEAALIDGGGQDIAAEISIDSSWDVRDTVLPPPRTRADGALVLERVPPGSYRLSARRGTARSEEAAVEVRAGGAVSVRFVLDG